MSPGGFSYDEAFSRNIGWITAWEQSVLRRKTVAIAGMGGVGGVHLLTLARMGIGGFRIADLDRFEIANFNRQIGATLATVGAPKVAVLADMARAINPEIDLAEFPDGVDKDNIDAFLAGADLFVDGLDFFVPEIRTLVFARAAALGIPAITAAPLGLGTAYLIFLPGGMSFEAYFRLHGLPVERQYVNFLMGLVPKGLQRPYLMDPTRIDLPGRRGPSSAAACQLCAGAAGAEALKILLGRGPVRAAPWYHQFDAYRGQWVRRRLIGGNRNPLQRLKLKAAYKVSAGLARQSWQPPARETGPEIMRILDLARWAPSGDNGQPWRFEIDGEDRLTVIIRSPSDDDVYDYNDGQPTLLSAGFLLETLRIAASQFGRKLWWTDAGLAEGGGHRIAVELPRTPGVAPDPLLPMIPLRSVDRRPYRARYLSAEERRALTEALGDELEISWHETRGERWRMARLNGRATDIRLRIPEAFRVHQRVLDWRSARSATGIPVASVGLDALTLKIIRWALGDWRRMARMNRMPAATLLARIQMDYAPGLACAAHFTVRRKAPPGAADDRVALLLRAGGALQRLWLTATAMGLVMQPSLAPLCFAHYGRHGVDFTADPAPRRAAARLAQGLEAITGGAGDDLLFLGRIGEPVSRRVGPRSLRRPLEDLLIAREETAAVPAAEREAVG